MDIRSACANGETTLTDNGEYKYVAPFDITVEEGMVAEIIDLLGGVTRLRYTLVGDDGARTPVESVCMVTGFRALPEPAVVTFTPIGPVVAV